MEINILPLLFPEIEKINCFIIYRRSDLKNRQANLNWIMFYYLDEVDTLDDVDIDDDVDTELEVETLKIKNPLPSYSKR